VNAITNAPHLESEPGIIDLANSSLRDLNASFHALPANTNETDWQINNPRGQHAVCVGITAPVTVTINGHVGYYCAGMNDGARITVHGNAGPGVAENMMSGEVHLTGDASHAAGATAHGGLLVIDGNAGARCGISMKGIDIVVKGSVGHMSAFMAQSGNLVVLGDAGEALGDSLYEARIFVHGQVASLGADCEEKTVTDHDLAILTAILHRAEITASPSAFRLYGSARNLYHFHVDHAGEY
jgi:glutamate synthase domain-containing protein 3